MSSSDDIQKLFKRGFIDPSSSDFSIEKLPDGRHSVELSQLGVSSLIAQAGGFGGRTVPAGGGGGGTSGGCPSSDSVGWVCDSISKSLTKCGFTGCSTGKTYLTQTTHLEWDCNCSGCIVRGDLTQVNQFDPFNCIAGNVLISCSGSAHSEGPSFSGCPPTTNDCTATGPRSPGSAFCDCPDSNCYTYLRCVSGPSCTFNSFCDSDNVSRQVTDCSSPCGSTCIETDTFTLSDEYTDALLVSNTQAALPTYPGTFSGTCSAFRNLSSDGSSLTIRRFIPKFQLSSPAPRALTIHYNEHFAPDAGSPSDVARTLSVGVGVSEITGPEVLEPSTNGTITVTDIIVTCP